MEDRQRRVKVIVIGGGLLILAAMVLTGSLTYLQVDKLLTDRVRRFDLHHLIAAKAYRLDSLLSRAVESSILLAEDPVMNAWFQSGERDKRLQGFALQRMKRLLHEPHYQRVFAANRLTGNFWVDGASIVDRMTMDDPDDSWFYETLRSKRQYHFNIDHNRELRNTYLWINAKMLNNSGVAGVGIDITGFTGQFTGKDKLDGISFLFDRNGRLQAGLSSRPGQPLHGLFGTTIAGQILQNPDGSYVLDYTSPSGQNYYLVHAPVAAGQWILIYRIPKQRLRQVQRLIGFNSLISVLLSAVLVIMIFIFVYGLFRSRAHRVA